MAKAKEDSRLVDTLCDVDSCDVGFQEAGYDSKSREVSSHKTTSRVAEGAAKNEKARWRSAEPEEALDASSSFYWHSFLLISGRLLNRVLEWYSSLFTLSARDKAKLFRNLSQHCLKRGAINKAMRYLKEWAKLEKSDPEPLYQMGVALSTLGEYQRAVNAFDKVLRLKPDHFIAVYRKSALLLKLKQFKEAINGLEHIVEETPDDPRAYYLLGLAYDGDGQLDKGIEVMSRAVELDPEEIKYHQHLGFMNVRRENHKTAAEHFTKVMELERELDEEAV